MRCGGRRGQDSLSSLQSDRSGGRSPDRLTDTSGGKQGVVLSLDMGTNYASGTGVTPTGFHRRECIETKGGTAC